MAKADIHDIREEERLEAQSFGEDLKIIEVTLSERNLLSLLAKLHIDGSRRTIYNDDVLSGYVLKLVVEDDEVHYKDRVPPSDLHPETEGLVTALQKALAEHEKNAKLVQLFTESSEKARGDSV